MKYSSRRALIDDIVAEHDSLLARLELIPKPRWREGGVWGEDWTLCDLVAHLAEWQDMFLRWYDDGLEGQQPDMPARGYKWNELTRLNHAIWEKHRRRSASAVTADFDAGYRRILDIAEGLSEAQLLKPGHFAWTGTHGLTTYLGANTASHYRFAKNVIKRWLKAS